MITNLDEFRKLNENREVYSQDALYTMEIWIKKIWSFLDKLSDDDLVKFFQEIEVQCGNDVAEIIDQEYSADKLHYHQNGATVNVGGIDTYNFIENFDTITQQVKNILKQFGINESIVSSVVIDTLDKSEISNTLNVLIQKIMGIAHLTSETEAATLLDEILAYKYKIF